MNEVMLLTELQHRKRVGGHLENARGQRISVGSTRKLKM